MPGFTTVVFDLDGTLIHSAPDLHAAANVALTALGRPSLGLAVVTSFIGNGVEILIHRCLEATGGTSADLHTRALAVFLDSYGENPTALTRPYAGVLDTLEGLASSGIRLGICTNKPTGPARQICDLLSLTSYFAAICGAEPDQAKKPDAQPLLHTIARLGGVPEQTLYVGDSGVDAQTAANAHVAFSLFTGGYLKGPASDVSCVHLFEHWDRHEMGALVAGTLVH